jgi:hypothetical protein
VAETIINPKAVDRLVPPDWQSVRNEYFKVWADFPFITKPFGITLSKTQFDALGHLLVSMDLIDSAIDRQPQQHTRQQLCESILSWMSGSPDSFRRHEYLDTDRLTELRRFIQSQKIARPFLAAAARVFVASEGKRNSTNVAEMIKHLNAEGQAAAEMTIYIMGANTNARLNDFSQRVMRIGAIVDSILDAHDDHEKGILKLAPNRWFRWRLKLAVACQLPGLILSFPDRRLLWRYCLSYTRDNPVPLNASSHPPIAA